MAGNDEEKKELEDKDPKKMDSDEERQFIQGVLKKFADCQTSMQAIRETWLDDMRFKAGLQWNEQLKKEREMDGRPSLVINKIPTSVNQVVNDYKQNKQQVKVIPVDDTDEEKAEVVNGIIRHLWNKSHAESAIDTALDHAVSGGFGFFRIRTNYKDNKSFDQDIIIERIDNPLDVYFPIHLVKKETWEDAPYCFYINEMDKEEYEEMYPDYPISHWDNTQRGHAGWLTNETVRIAEFFTVECEEIIIYLLSNGKVVDKKPKTQEVIDMIIDERKSEKRIVKWYKMTAQNILDSTELYCSYLPIVPVLGAEICLEGQKTYISLVRWAKDAQRLYNIGKSLEIEWVSLAPKAPFIVAEGQIEDYRETWMTANRKNHSALVYKPTSLNGTLVPMPQRSSPPGIPGGAVEFTREASEDIKSTTGIFDASLGMSGNEKSGRAIMARSKQGQTTNFHFYDNLTKSLWLANNIILQLIPHIYDTQRTIRIIGEDKQDKVIKINKEYQDETSGEKVLFDLSVGEYDLVVTTGASYESKRQEAQEMLLSFVQAFPPAAQVAGDIIAANLDIPYAQDLAARMKRTIPPQILGETQQNPDLPTPEDMQAIIADVQNLQAQLQQSDMEKAEMAKDIEKLLQQLKDKQADYATRIAESKIHQETEFMKAQADLQKEMFKQRVQSANARLSMQNQFGQS